ncbi:MAG: putative porin [Bacteroidales bacterium]|nr:putative porin [Bacteroidales bacterium]
MTKKFNKKYFILFIVFFSFASLKAQHDSDSLKNILLIWNLEDNFTKNNIQLEDSSAETFHNSSDEEKWSILTSNLGNFGSANISDIFIKRDDDFNRDFLFSSPYFIFLKNSGNVNYYNTRRPYTAVMHTTSTKIRNLQTINFTHTQNINPNFNVAANFDFLTSKGQTDFQETKVNTSVITLNYNKNRYFLHASFVFNKINNENSGGFIDSLGSDTKFPPPNMTEANISLNNQEISATQQYRFGQYKNISYRDTIMKVLEPKISLSHNLVLYKKYRLYSDTEIPRSETTSGSGLYNNFFYNEEFTSDSISLTGISNKIKLGSEQVFEEKNKFGFSIILEADLKEYYNFKDYIILENSNVFFENNVTAKIFSEKFLNSETFFFVKYYYTGFRKNDFRTKFDLIKVFKVLKSPVLFNINFEYTNYKPDYFKQNYYSNHFFWENELEKIKEYEGLISFKSEKYKTQASFNTSAIYNYTFLEPAKGFLQYDSIIFILTANLKKDFSLNKFKISNNIYWQKSSNENKIPLPQLALLHSTSIKFQYKDALLTYLGYEVYFSSKYKVLNFNSAIGQFYSEGINSPVIGNYPFVGVFMNLKIKKNVLLSFKFQHINSGLLNVKYPVQINHYPVYGRLFKFSIRWTFKN